MAFADKKGIVVASPFKLQAESMLDVRQQVDTLTERNELVTIKAATAGLRVYVKETKKSYVYNGTTWDELSIGNASLVVTLNGGTSEGTNKFTYNGTAAKTVNITADGIGAASKTHNHTKSQITDFPTSMKNPQALKFTGGATATYDGSKAVTVNIPTTAITSKSLVVTLNGGTTEGTNKFTFNGSTEKNINITPSTIGAAAATHTHNVNQITGLTTGRALVSDANGHPSVSSTTATELSYLHGVTSSVQTQLNNKAALNHTHNYAGSSYAGGAANSAVKLQTARKLNGVSFDGSVDINIPNNYFASMDEEDLNQKVTFGEYYGAGGNSCKNLPSGVDWFYLRIFKTASGYVGQNLYANGTWYSRYKNGTSWTSWSEQYSSTNKPTPSEIGAAASSHTHTASQITGLPTSLKNPYAITFTGAATGTYDGSRAVTINIPTTGATTKASLVIQLNGGTTEGDDKFTFNGGTTKTVNITPASIGAAAASHGTHVTYSTTAPKANGTASAGTAASVSRSDHVHPAQTTVSGNAGSATKLQTKRNIDGVQFDGSANIVHFGSCSTAAGTAAKVVSCTGFVLVSGSRITVKFTTTNTAANPTLNVNSTGAKAIKYRGSTISAGYLAAGRVYTFIYDGTNYELVGDINTDTNTTYNTGTASTAGLTKLYTTTGSAVDGTMTQKAITDALSGKASSSHTHGVASTTANGFLKQLDGSTSHFMRGDGVWATPPNTTYSAFKAATSSAAGGAGLVPAPAAGAQSKFLRGDATWQTISLYTFGVTATATELNYMDGVTSNVQTQLNGKAASSHTHNYAGSSSAGGAANSVKTSLVIQLNGGNTEGTNKFTFNGSAAKTINITPSSIGAAAASHTHNYAGSSSVGGAANSAVKLTTARTINGTSFDGTKNITLNAMYAEDLSNKNVSLNTYNLSSGTPKVKYYFCPTDGAGDGITGRPDDARKNAFFLICESVRFSSTTDYITKQTYIHGATKTTWERYCTNGTWSAWGERYTSQNKPTASEIGAASSSHTHNYAGSSSAGGAANSVKSSLTLQFNGTTKATFNGSAAATVNITPSSIGAAASSHTHNYAGSSSAGGAANSVKAALTLQLNGSTKATFNGSTAATVNITASSIGAAASNHTHSYLPLSGGTVTGDIGLPSGRANKDGSTPLAGSTITNLSSITKLANYKTVLGSYTDSNDKWYDIISVRHRNGNGDGSSYGMYLKSDLTSSGNLSWGKQYGSSSWQAERTLIDSSNYGSWCAAKSHTHNYAGSSSAGGAANSVKSALTIQFNGTTKATFNGSAAATVNITPSAIGAAAASHTHNYAGSSSAGGAANSANRVPVPVGTVLFATSSSTTFFNSCFGGTWEIVGNIDAIVGNGTTIKLYMFRKTKA